MFRRLVERYLGSTDPVPTGQPVASEDEVLGHALFPSLDHPVVFDIGANSGQTVAKILQLSPLATVYAFEPTPSAYDQLSKTFMKKDNVKLFNLACSHKDGTETISLHQYSLMNSLLPFAGSRYISAAKFQNIGTAKIRSTRLDSFLKQNELQCIDLMKVDTQGFELKVLDGCGDFLTPGFIKAFIIEVLFVHLYEGQADYYEVFSRLAQAGYQLHTLFNLAKDESEGLRWADAYFC